MYEIIGYDICNGEKHQHKLINHVTVDTITKIDELERKVERRYLKRGETVQCYAIYRTKKK